MALFAPGVAQGVLQAQDAMRLQAEQQQAAAQRKQTMDYQSWLMNQAKQQQADQQRYVTGAGRLLTPPPVAPQTPSPGQSSQPMQPPGMQPPAAPPMFSQGQGMGQPQAPQMVAPVMQQTMGQSNPPIPPYRSLNGQPQGMPQPNPQATPPGAPPPVGDTAPKQSPVGMLEQMIAKMDAQGIPPEDRVGVLTQLSPFLKDAASEEMMRMREQGVQITGRLKELEYELKKEKEEREGRKDQRQGDQADTRLAQGQERIDKKNSRAGAGGDTGGANIGTLAAPSETVQNLAADLIAGRKKGDILVSRGKVSASEFDAARNLAMKQLMDSGMDRVSASNALATGASNRVALDMTLRDRVKNKTAVDQYARQVEDQMKLVDDTLASSGLNTPKILNTKINALRSSMSSEQLAALRPVIAGLAREVQKLTTAPTSNAQLHVTATSIYDKIINEDMSIAEARAAMKSLQKEIVISRNQADKTVDVLQDNLKNVDARGEKPAAGGASGGDGKVMSLDEYLKSKGH